MNPPKGRDRFFEGSVRKFELKSSRRLLWEDKSPVSIEVATQKDRHDTRSKRKAARVLRPTVGGGEAHPLSCVSVFKYRDGLRQFGTHVIGLAKTAHPLRGKTRCARPLSRPREGATPTDTPATAATDTLSCGGNGVFGCPGSTRVPAGTSPGGIKFATGRSGDLVPETTAKPRATAPVVLHAVSDTVN